MATQFKDLGITAEKKQRFTGDKIKIERLFDREIMLYDYDIKPSNYTDKGSGKRLDMQISINGTMHVTWTGSEILMSMAQKIPPDAFPVTTTIKKNNGGYEFT